ncbi:MAG TPA: sulfate adenylyltransferase subunit 1, partial [Acidobacteriaceae bacterium]|nr:sulfate adenylyltransferase subunit 1 [Acidobacteriaceae bacterium]
MAIEELHLSDAAREARFRTFLDAHLDQELLRFTTAGSVDDGKSTLIGRLLHDTKSVYEDQLASIRASRVNRSGGAVDLSLLTDGLRAEREQGITIDVAYRYFSTSKRKFIIADTPGHEQYTRNMATGASTADVAVVLIDANAFVKAGTLLPQSRRHTYIASLLRIPHVVAAVNKMDLVGYSEDVFSNIRTEFLALAQRLHLRSVELIPVSALAGDNVVDASTNMPWYTGPTLLDFLETVPLEIAEGGAGPLRFPVQLVVRPDANFRGFAGRVERGELRPGLAVRALPSGRTSRVRSLVTWDGELKQAHAPQSVTVELEDEIDLSRGEMLVADGQTSPTVSTRLRAMAVWMHEQPLIPGATCLLKHTTRTVRATVRAIGYRVNVNTAEHQPAGEVAMNDIAEIELETSLPLFFDPYAENRSTGSFILIDPLSNATLAAGMLLGVAEEAPLVGERAKPVFVLLPGAPRDALERRQAELEGQGLRAVILDDPLISEEALPAAVRALQLAGV